MQPERPECQCLGCAQLQHHQANDTLLLFAIGTVLVVSGLVWLVGQVAGLLAIPIALGLLAWWLHQPPAPPRPPAPPDPAGAAAD
jgi:hypothetical protein